MRMSGVGQNVVGTSSNDYDPLFVPRYIDSTCDNGTNYVNNGNWYFAGYKYSCSGDQFVDPDGTNYSILFGGSSMSYYWDSWNVENKIKDHVILMTAGTKCSGKEEKPIEYGDGAGLASVVYILEGGAIYCGDNQ